MRVSSVGRIVCYCGSGSSGVNRGEGDRLSFECLCSKGACGTPCCHRDSCDILVLARAVLRCHRAHRRVVMDAVDAIRL